MCNGGTEAAAASSLLRFFFFNYVLELNFGQLFRCSKLGRLVVLEEELVYQVKEKPIIPPGSINST